MPMPKTSVHEDDGFVFRQYDVRVSGKILSVQPESITVFMEKRTHDFLGFRVLPLDLGHDFASFFRRYAISQKEFSPRPTSFLFTGTKTSRCCVPFLQNVHKMFCDMIGQSRRNGVSYLCRDLYLGAAKDEIVRKCL